MTTYLSLVNSAMVEAGVDLDSLTSGNFATTTDPMATRFKTWVNQALREIELERNEWEFKTKQAQYAIYPRLLIIDGDVEPAADDTFQAVDSDATFTAVGYDLLSGTWAGDDAIAHLDILSLSGPVSFNELVDKLTPSTASSVFRIKWFGRYDLESDISDLLEPDMDTFFIQGASGLTDTTLNTGDTDLEKLEYVPWANFVSAGWESSQSWGRPRVITQTPDGQYDFYPRPEQAYIITFSYSAEPQSLSLYSDTVTDLPAQYHDMIFWRAVMYYADYDSKPSMFARAERRYQFFKNRAEKNLKPQITWGWNRYATRGSF